MCTEPNTVIVSRFNVGYPYSLWSCALDFMLKYTNTTSVKGLVGRRQYCHRGGYARAILLPYTLWQVHSFRLVLCDKQQLYIWNLVPLVPTLQSFLNQPLMRKGRRMKGGNHIAWFPGTTEKRQWTIRYDAI